MNGLTVIYRPTEDGCGNWFVFDGDRLVETFHNNAAAWAYVDRHSADGLEDEERRRRIDTAFS